MRCDWHNGNLASIPRPIPTFENGAVAMSKPRGKGLWGWLGRQVGYVSKAVKTDVGNKTVYRDSRVEERPLPGDPNVKLRRTVIDEVVVEKPSPPSEK
jgi:hypothetical protein